jgi:hypothetical protein
VLYLYKDSFPIRREASQRVKLGHPLPHVCTACYWRLYRLPLVAKGESGNGRRSKPIIFWYRLWSDRPGLTINRTPFPVGINIIAWYIDRILRIKIFYRITKGELEKKFKRVNFPMILSQSWGSTTPHKAVLSITILKFTTPIQQLLSGFMRMFGVGSGNVGNVTGAFLDNVAARFSKCFIKKSMHSYSPILYRCYPVSCCYNSRTIK